VVPSGPELLPAALRLWRFVEHEPVDKLGTVKVKVVRRVERLYDSLKL
jgi:hypothetical protein